MDSAGQATIASIHIYPVKAVRAVDLAEAEVQPCGLAGDRRWLVVDPDGQFITQRAEPALAVVSARYGTGGSLHLSEHGSPSFSAGRCAWCTWTTRLAARWIRSSVRPGTG